MGTPKLKFTAAKLFPTFDKVKPDPTGISLSEKYSVWSAGIILSGLITLSSIQSFLTYIILYIFLLVSDADSLL